LEEEDRVVREKEKIIITHRNNGLESSTFWCGILYYRNYPEFNFFLP